MFLHAGWIHVLGNMLFLWVFGDNVEDILGHAKYLLFYLLCGVTAGLAQVVIDPYSRVPMVGASGAIAGVMGAYLVKFPRSEVKMLTWFIFIFTFDVPAWLMLIYWFAMQLFGGYGSLGEAAQGASQGGTAFFAHIGGFIMGIILIFLMGTHQRYWRRKDLSW
jgi:membrane associated rhomboid family serine protease